MVSASFDTKDILKAKAVQELHCWYQMECRQTDRQTAFHSYNIDLNSSAGEYQNAVLDYAARQNGTAVPVITN